MTFAVYFNGSKVITTDYLEAWDIFRNADAEGLEAYILDVTHNEVFASNEEGFND